MKKQVALTLQEMVLSGEVLKIRVGEQHYHALSESLDLLNKPLARTRLKILSPFDNLVIQRKRMHALFGFDYLIECYVPKAKRQYGYFSLPVLWDGRLVARMDCKSERKEALLHVLHLALEPGLTEMEKFLVALRREMTSFLKFNQCNRLRLHKSSPTKIMPALQLALDDLGS